MIAPNFNLQMIDLLTLLFGMITLLVFIWASKKVLDFIGFENFNIKIEAKKQIRIEDRQRLINSYKQDYRKKQELKKQEKQNIKQEKVKTVKLNKKRESIRDIQKRLYKKEKYVSKGGSKLRSKTGRVITSHPKKVYHTRDFMSKKYRDAVIHGKFKKKRTYRYQRNFTF